MEHNTHPEFVGVDGIKEKHAWQLALGGAEILALSWGWDLAARAPVTKPHPDQRWQGWPVRLFKCATSLRLFGFPEQFDSLKAYGAGLVRVGVDLSFRGRGLSAMFRE